MAPLDLVKRGQAAFDEDTAGDLAGPVREEGSDGHAVWDRLHVDEADL